MPNPDRAFLSLVAGIILVVGALMPGPSQGPPGEQTQEMKEVQAAGRITDAVVRLKEFERIKAAYPKSPLMTTIDGFIHETKIDLAPTVEAILSLQKGVVGQGGGTARMTSYVQAASRILGHPRLATFNKAKVLNAILGYRDGLANAATQPETFASMPDKDAQKAFTANNLRYFDLLIAQAQANADDGAAAMASLDRFMAAGGDADSEYMSALGDAYAKLGRDEEAYGAYLGAAVQNFRGAADKARTMYAKITGRTDGFENRLETLLRALPYRPAPFTPSRKWKGKTVLAEIFTDAESPSSAAVDLGFGGLVDTYPAQYLAILAFHIPLPGPDPLMNPATKKRQDYYGIVGQPTVVIDGIMRMIGGGTRGVAGSRFKQYKTVIDARINTAPDVTLKVQAARAGDIVTAELGFDKNLPGAQYFIVLTQGEELYKGSSGVILHRLVVRDMTEIRPAASKTATFNLAASEIATDAYLNDFEKTFTQVPNFKFAERHTRIERQGLQVVFFVQDAATKRVLNAIVGDVK